VLDYYNERIVKMRKTVTFFVSYAHGNSILANAFLEKLKDILAPSKRYEYHIWIDTGLIVGEDWETQIIAARDSCDFGLLLVSPTFLSSKFITQKELPLFVGEKSKPSIPVMLQPVDFDLHDLKGLDKKQIFRLDYHGFKEPRAYGECKGPRKNTFVLELFKAIEKKLARHWT
jgi:hypothetical protein